MSFVRTYPVSRQLTFPRLRLQLTFVTCTFALWALSKKYDVLAARIWSPFLLMTGFVWLQLGAAFEIGNHFYINDWQLYEPISDLINASFSFMNFGAQDLNALGLRKKGLLSRRPARIQLCRSGSLDIGILRGHYFYS